MFSAKPTTDARVFNMFFFCYFIVFKSTPVDVFHLQTHCTDCARPNLDFYLFSAYILTCAYVCMCAARATLSFSSSRINSTGNGSKIYKPPLWITDECWMDLRDRNPTRRAELHLWTEQTGLHSDFRGSRSINIASTEEIIYPCRTIATNSIHMEYACSIAYIRRGVNSEQEQMINTKWGRETDKER